MTFDSAGTVVESFNQRRPFGIQGAEIRVWGRPRANPLKKAFGLSHCTPAERHDCEIAVFREESRNAGNLPHIFASLECSCTLSRAATCSVR